MKLQLRHLLLAGCCLASKLVTAEGPPLHGAVAAAPRRGGGTGRHAYVAVQYGDRVEGLQALGASLLRTGTQADLVALLHPSVGRQSERRLVRSGWGVRRATQLGGDPYIGTALEAWLLSDYESVVLVGKDVLVLENVDELFTCDAPLCFVPFAWEIISSGVVVVRPSVEVHGHMVSALRSRAWAAGDVHSFLGGYMSPHMSDCTYFDPAVGHSQHEAMPAPHPVCHRLPTRYSGELLLVVLNGGLTMVRSQNPMPDEWWALRRARVVIYNIAGLQPAWWVSAPFLPMTQVWHQLTAQAAAAAGESSWWEPALLLCIPPLLCTAAAAATAFRTGAQWLDRAAAAVCTALLLARIAPDRSSEHSSGRSAARGARSWRFLALHAALAVGSFAAAAAAAARFAGVARGVCTSWAVFLSWLCCALPLAWTVYLAGLHMYGGAVASGGSARGRNTPRKRGGGSGGPAAPLRETLLSAAVWVLLWMVLPLASGVLGGGERAHIVCAGAVAAALALHSTVESLRLPVLWYLHGLQQQPP